ncbi:hypothetical protein [cf. Phormidesmis sp. LEGE 11477]|uniref:hypothetical protein n=1 Tax=cf. Phormidesmis sp. LEGE 11477 TaxID=1828680 RepID=UPI00187E00D2|nr:hypothetical protein [cf. Phormidesmis sp. LEGE 11477]MBE9062238.1 hypothetical protein [cf. Phormidesmis sp. LEGE 11477]
MNYPGLQGAGGYTQSSSSRTAEASASGASYYTALSIALIYMKIKAAFKETEAEEEEDSQAVDVEVEDQPENFKEANEYSEGFNTDEQPLIEGKAIQAIEGASQDQLAAMAPPTALPPDRQSVKDKIDRIAQTNPVVTVKIGDTVLAEPSSSLLERLEELGVEEQKAFAEAMQGENPTQRVSITIEEENINFLATPENNLGWTVPTTQADVEVAQSEIIEEVRRQNSKSHQKIKSAAQMQAVQDGIEEGTYPLHGESKYSVLVTSDAVFVFDQKSGLVQDSVEIGEVSNLAEKITDQINGLTRQEQTREALADYGGPRHAKPARSSSAIPKVSRRQNELTP